jgi:hypothetical protein
MKGIDLLQKHTASAVVIRAWFLEKMIESLQTSDVPDEFKNMMRETGIEDDKLAIMIDANPRMLLDVFDDNNIYLNIFRVKNIFMWSLYDIEEQILDGRVFNTRKETELSAIEAAFEILENKLSPKIEENN